MPSSTRALENVKLVAVFGLCVNVRGTLQYIRVAVLKRDDPAKGLSADSIFGLRRPSPVELLCTPPYPHRTHKHPKEKGQT